jgi:hypothetical protein
VIGLLKWFDSEAERKKFLSRSEKR